MYVMLETGSWYGKVGNSSRVADEFLVEIDE